MRCNGILRRLASPIVVLALAFGLAAGTAHAQEEPDPLSIPERYEVISVEAGSNGGHIAILLDTAYGRTWILETNADGTVSWRRIFILRPGDTPDGFTNRPLVIRP